MDLGVSRTIDHAVYTMLNAIAVILWRIDSAIIGMSMTGYHAQDWLTGKDDGGVWLVFEKVSGPNGIFGLLTWQAFLTLAIMLFGISRVMRAFMKINPVDPGRMLLFAVFSYSVIQGGASMMQDVEVWRADVGDYMYQAVAADGKVDIDLPGVTPNNEPINPPADLDGEAPIRGWEAVATSYFLVQSEEELNSNIPPREFLQAYCLYDPYSAIQDQTDQNDAGCSPERAWDEWDMLSTQPITQVLGIPLPIDVSLSLPIVQEHPENRQLAIRQAQSGIARLAMGPVVALYPMLESSISLMLALSASMIYLSLPLMLMFGFFTYTESMATRLLLRMVNIVMQTILLNGLIALFLLILIKVSVQGSLMAYLGLTSVAVIGGFFLSKVAMDSMKETFSMALSAVGTVWMGTATGLFGQEAAKPATAMLGAAKWAGAGALMAAGGLGMFHHLKEVGSSAVQSGVRDFDRATPDVMANVRQRAGQLPGPLANLAQDKLLDTEEMAGSDPEGVPHVGPRGIRSSLREGQDRRDGTMAGRQNGIGSGWGREAAAAGMMNAAAPVFSLSGQPKIWGSQEAEAEGRLERDGVIGRYSQEERQDVHRAVQQIAVQDQDHRYIRSDGSMTHEGLQAVMMQMGERRARAFTGDQGQRDLAALIEAQQDNSRARGWGAPEVRQGRVDGWVDQVYQSRESGGRGDQRVLETGRNLFGEELGPEARRALDRHSEAETRQAFQAIREAAAEMPPDAMIQNGTPTTQGLQAVREKLDALTARSYNGRQGEQDLAVLTGMIMQRDATAQAEDFRRTTARAQDGVNERAPARTVPRELGLDPVAAGPHYSDMNRFVRLSDQAGLNADQRERLLAEARGGEVSDALQSQLATSLRRQEEMGRVVTTNVDDLVASAQALPNTLSGPTRVGLPDRLLNTGATSQSLPTTSQAEAVLGQQPVVATQGQARQVADIAPVDLGAAAVGLAAGRQNGHQAEIHNAAAIRETLLQEQDNGDDRRRGVLVSELRGQGVITPETTRATRTAPPSFLQQVVDHHPVVAAAHTVSTWLGQNQGSVDQGRTLVQQLGEFHPVVAAARTVSGWMEQNQAPAGGRGRSIIDQMVDQHPAVATARAASPWFELPINSIRSAQDSLAQQFAEHHPVVAAAHTLSNWFEQNQAADGGERPPLQQLPEHHPVIAAANTVSEWFGQNQGTTGGLERSLVEQLIDHHPTVMAARAVTDWMEQHQGEGERTDREGHDRPMISKIEPLARPAENIEAPGSAQRMGHAGHIARHGVDSLESLNPADGPRLPYGGYRAAGEESRPSIADELRGDAKVKAGPDEAALRSKLFEMGEQQHAGGTGGGVAAELRRGRIDDEMSGKEPLQTSKRSTWTAGDSGVVEALDSSSGQQSIPTPPIVENTPGAPQPVQTTIAQEPALPQNHSQAPTVQATDEVTATLRLSQSVVPVDPEGVAPRTVQPGEITGIVQSQPGPQEAKTAKQPRMESLQDYFGPNQGREGATVPPAIKPAEATSRVSTRAGRTDTPLMTALGGQEPAPEPKPKRSGRVTRQGDTLIKDALEREPLTRETPTIPADKKPGRGSRKPASPQKSTSSRATKRGG